MAQPWPHPKTGVFWFRRAVPKDLRARVGKSEELLTLSTKDASEARVRYAKVSAEVEARWANLRAGERSLTEREAHSLAAAAHDAWLGMHGDEPSEQFTWHPRLYGHLWTKRLPEGLPSDGQILVPDDLFLQTMRRFCFVQTDNCLAHHGLIVDELSRIKLAKAIGASFQRASLTLAEVAAGIATPEDVPALTGPFDAAGTALRTGSSASTARPRKAPQPAPALTMTGLFQAWWREAEAAGRKPSTKESYQNTVKGFVGFLKHDDATRITADDVVAFKDHRLSTPSKRTGKIPSAKTVKDSDLSALKTLFSWAVMNRKLPTNPATGLTIKVGKKAQNRDKGFVESEALAILSAALAYQQGPKEKVCTAAAKRWIPWLCAFSGARVGEIGQMRRQDIRKEGEFWVMRITPDAGTVKTNEARDVVLHPQLIELGFPAFLDGTTGGCC